MRLEFRDVTSSKFHENYIHQAPNGLFMLQAVWGRIGTAGTTQKVR